MNFLSQTGAFTGASADIINANFAQLAGLTQGQGTAIFLDTVNGRDYNNGTSPTDQGDGTTGAVQSLQRAYNLATSGKNDVVAVLGDGGTAASVRISETFTWAKNATHLVGVASNVNISNRARIAPPSGATAFANFFVVSGSGCNFLNLQWFHGFGTGTTSAICMAVTGGRNYFGNCHIAGMGDDASAQSAGSRSLKISTTGENVFDTCTIGVDTVTRTQANASVEFAAAVPRNQFRDCLFPFMGSAAGVLGILGTGNGCVDRFQLFDRCLFINAIKSTSTTMTVLSSFTTASPGGLLLFNRSVLVGITDYGDTNGLANSYIDGLTGAAATSGIAVNPS